MSTAIHLVECPRDAMQGWPHQISTEDKIAYISTLLQVGFHTLDCLSFVSAKAIPQMADSHEVVRNVDKRSSSTKVLAIVVNPRGANDALQHDVIDVLGYPFSISPTFQMRNANSSIGESWKRLLQIRDLCFAHHKELCVYLSMAFGNPYGDDYNPGVVLEWIGKMEKEGIRIVSLADTVGLASAEQVLEMSGAAIASYPTLEIGVHLHSSAQNWQEKMQAALDAGIHRFDGALKGFGGCPMANNDLVGNMNTEWMIDLLQQQGKLPAFNQAALQQASEMALQIFR